MRYWSVLFALAAFFAVGVFAYAAVSPDWWLPNPPGEPYSRRLDVRTRNRQPVSDHPLDHRHRLHRHPVALVWVHYRLRTPMTGRAASADRIFTAASGLKSSGRSFRRAILVFIALYQMGTWAAIKFRGSCRGCQPLAEVTARQFQWVIRYPGPDGKLNTADDLYTVNDLHFVKEKTGVDLPQVDGCAPLVLFAAVSGQAGRRAGPDDPGLV